MSRIMDRIVLGSHTDYLLDDLMKSDLTTDE